MPRTKGSKNSNALSPTVLTSAISITDGQRYARLSREVKTLLDYWGHEGVIEEEVNRALMKIEKAWQGWPQKCRCNPPQSGLTLCTGHCLS